MTTDAGPTYRMPAETEPQDRVWMAFPVRGYSLGDTREAAHEARSTWAAVAHAVAEFEPVTMVVDPGERAAAAKYLSSVPAIEGTSHRSRPRSDTAFSSSLADISRCGQMSSFLPRSLLHSASVRRRASRCRWANSVSNLTNEAL